MLTINVIHRNEEKFLNGALFGEKFNLPFTEEKYAQLKAKQEEYNEFTTTDELPAWEEDVKALLNEETFDVIETACPDLKKDSRTGNYYVVVEGEVSVTPVPDKLVEVILESVDKGISPEPIVKAWIRFLRNPNFTPEKAINFSEYITAEIVDSEEMYRLIDEEGFTEDKARDRATYNDVSITQCGLIACRKYARLITEGWEINKETNEAVKVSLFPKSPKTVNKITGVVAGDEPIMPDFVEELYFKPPVMGDGGDEFTCGDELGHVIQVGKKHTLPRWSMVNTDDSTNCKSGLHVGGIQYCRSYEGLNCQLLECFVDPAEIGAIVDIYNNTDGAIRVREYFVYGAVKGRSKGIYHSSTYAKMKDAEWEEYKKEAVKAANEHVDALQKTLDNFGK